VVLVIPAFIVMVVGQRTRCGGSDEENCQNRRQQIFLRYFHSATLGPDTRREAMGSSPHSNPVDAQKSNSEDGDAMRGFLFDGFSSQERRRAPDVICEISDHSMLCSRRPARGFWRPLSCSPRRLGTFRNWHVGWGCRPPACNANYKTSPTQESSRPTDRGGWSIIKPMWILHSFPISGA